ncbi:MAG TPA: ABC transporter ATP-binding protein [Mycobacteriales bacterium]|nr:ABC transporter ATP-binding protein [Mycobacteriales bacterium]
MSLLHVDGLATKIVLRDRTVHAVNGVSFDIHGGEAVGLVGESGSGKSMTGASILRLLPAGGEITAGRIELDGRDLVALPDKQMRAVRGREIALISQDPMTALDPTMTIGTQIAEPLLIHGLLPKDATRDRVLELLSMVGVPQPEERIDNYPHQLSGGLRQRVCIAMAIACEPKLLIADEPTTALDVSVQDQILRLLRRLRSELGMALLLITHDMGVIAEHTDRVMVMYAGRIAESARTTELFRQTRHPYTEALLGALPRVNQTAVEGLYSIPGSPPSLTELVDACRFAPRCRYASDRCRTELPLPTVAPDGHLWECFHPRDGASVATVREAAPPPPPPATRAVLAVADDVVREYPIGGARLWSRRALATVKAVSGVSFEVYRGETLGVVGESGCGKSTVGRMLVGLEAPDAGAVMFDGAPIRTGRGKAERRRHSRDVQMIFQDPYASLDPRMRVRAILDEPLVIQRTFARDERLARIAELLRDVGLDPAAAGLLPREFSGGQRQRIGFARALALRPRLIVADEPVSALDVSIRAQLLNLMRQLQEAHDLTYVMISHDLSVVRYLADRVAVMYLGKLVEIGQTAEIYQRPAHPYTAGLLEAVPVPDPEAAASRERVAIGGELPSAVEPPSGCRFRTRCPRAQELCAKVEPRMSTFAGDGHLAACHFPLQPVVTGGGAEAA